MKCSNCGHRNRAGVNFCEQCGSQLNNAAPQPVVPVIVRVPARPTGYAFSWLLTALILLTILFTGLMLFDIIETPAFAAPYVDPLFARIRTNLSSIYEGQDQEISLQKPSKITTKKMQDNLQDLGETCFRSNFVSETIPDYSQMAPGETFSKSWTIRNGGDCDWLADTEMRFIEGDRMGGTRTLPTGKIIASGNTSTFTLDLKAPNKPGTYTGVWQLFAHDNSPMGRYWVIINVTDPQGQPADPPPVPPTPPFAITNVTTNLVDVSVTECPYPKDLVLTFTASGNGTATFEVETNDLGKHGQDTITFADVDSKTKTYTWTFTYSDDYWLKVFIFEPNNKTFGPYNFKVTCP